MRWKIMDEQVAAGYKVRWWKRIAYYNIDEQCAIAYPIGIHLLARWIRRIYEWSFKYKKSKFEKMLDKSFYQGRESGREHHQALFDRMATTAVACADNLSRLLNQVESKFPNETRYQTALRYIKEAESNDIQNKT